MKSIDDLNYTIRHRVINKGKFTIRYPWYRIQYGQSLPQFYTTIDIDPNRIKRFIYPGFFREGRFPRFEDGNWDKNKRSESIRSYPNKSERAAFKISDYDVYQSIYDRYINELPWSETKYYSVAMERINESKYWHNITTKKELMDRFYRLDAVYEDISKNGYKSSEELDKFISEEIIVSIGRDGEIFLDDGRHRLFIAKILGIDRIPVWVLVRHKEWQEKRQRWFKSAKITCSHPDINDI